jgi:hypothetical protein
MRRRVVVAALLGVIGAAGFIACGIDESGQAVDGGSDVTIGDAPLDANDAGPADVVQACKTLDATACFDGSLPDGWTFTAMATTNTACPGSDYTKSPYLYNLVPDSGCTCSCTASGSMDCSQTLTLGWTPACPAKAKYDAGNDAACIAAGGNDRHVGVDSLASAKVGTAVCDASSPPPTWSSSQATSCAPGCTADFCGANQQGFMRCIISGTSALCPAPFTQSQPLLGTNVNATCTCGCGLSDQPCTAQISAYNSPDCGGSAYETFDADGVCQDMGGGTNVNSFYYAPTVPAPSCRATDAAPSVTFTQPVTVCCLP